MPETSRHHRDHEAASPTRHRHRDRERHRERDRERDRDRHHRRKRGAALSADALAQLNASYERATEDDEIVVERREEEEEDDDEPRRRRRHDRARSEGRDKERRRREAREREARERAQREAEREERERERRRSTERHRSTDRHRSGHDRNRSNHDRNRSGHDRPRHEPRHDHRRYRSLHNVDGDTASETSDDGYDRVAAGGAGDRQHRRQRDRRIVSGAVLEEGRSRGIPAAAEETAPAAPTPPATGFFGRLRGGWGSQKTQDKRASSSTSSSSSSSQTSVEKAKAEQLLYYKKEKASRAAGPGWSKKKKLVVFGSLAGVVLVVLLAVVGVVVSKKKGGTAASSPASTSSSSSNNIGTIPSGAPDWLNPYTWADTTDFNLTYTNETVGGLPVMGLNTSYDDSASANGRTAALDADWGSYATTPARGVNLGGWLSLEPFITPSLFNRYDASLGIVDEWTLCAHLGAAQCGRTLEAHYATFVTEATFAEIAAAGLDHVRIPFSYWAVAVYDDDPYVFRTSWRYLLRGIEWARRHGLRVNLDLHGLPGSQNGWNHSGRLGAIGWLNGTQGDENAARSLAVHDQLSQFFAQARYRHVISHYGLANEPRMTYLSVAAVMNWTQTAAAVVRGNGVGNGTVIVFGDGFCGLERWQGQPNAYNLALDVHQYEIFNNAQLVYTHAEKIRYACTGWTQQTEQSMDTSTGFGPTLVAEWSQADTDCAPYLGNVGNGNRWTGTYDVGNASLNALTPQCPAQNATCGCALANADPPSYSAEYKQFLLMFAEAQMHSFEKGWGWWYWTWDTEAAPQWSYRQGLAAGILPADASQRSFQCDTAAIPDFSGLPEWY